MFHGAVLNQALPFLQRYFLNPAGLLALLALIPLLVIYLMRPEPKERVMPSMEFFMEEKRSGRRQKALRKLQRNLLLLLHIVFIILLAAALAEPYVTGEETAERAVLVVDVSASMADDMDSVERFVERNAGKTNTLVLVGERVEVPLENAPKRKVVQHVRNLDTSDVETDLVSGLEVARGYEGRIAVASDLDQSVGEGGAVETLESLEAAGREISVMETSQGNSWGFVGLRPSRGNSSLDVKNFRESRVSVKLSSGRASRTLDVPPGEAETVKVPTPEGRTTVELEGDGIPADNTAFISIPEERDFRVLLISDTGNRYLEKAVELINFTSIRTVSPPLNQVPQADVYIIGESDKILRSTVAEVENRVREGASMVVFAQKGIFDKSGVLPVQRTGGRSNVSVEIEEPRRILVGETRVFNVKVSRGEPLATQNALVRASHASGEVVLYNIRDSDFHSDFLYPVFWKELLSELTDRPSVEERNLRTGNEIDSSSVTVPGGQEKQGEVAMRDAGFYESPRGTFAANLLSPDESGEEDIERESSVSGREAKADKPLQKLAAALLLFVALGEFGYLWWRGSV